MWVYVYAHVPTVLSITTVTVVRHVLYTGVDSCDQFWLAGSRVEQSSISPFIWTYQTREDDTVYYPMSYSNWAPGQPDNAGDESSVREACLAMMKPTSPNTKSWFDVSCGEKICAICEY